MQKVPLNTMFRGGFLKAFAPFAQLIAEPDSKSERKLCRSMLNNKNELFMERSVQMIINWEREKNTTQIIHIHGTDDHTIPIRNIDNITCIINKASKHFNFFYFCQLK